MNVGLVDSQTKKKIAIDFFSDFFIEDFCLDCELQLNIFDFVLDLLNLPAFIITAAEFKESCVVFILLFEETSVDVLIG